MRNMVLQKRKPKLETSQVRVPGSDIVITVVYNRKQDVFFELAPGHAYLKGLPEAREICMVQPEILKSQMKFIMDTGCGHDLVSQGKVTRNDLETFVGNKTMHFQTANGTTDSDIVTRFSTNCFDEPVEAHILESTPSVLSVGNSTQLPRRVQGCWWAYIIRQVRLRRVGEGGLRWPGPPPHPSWPPAFCNA